MRTIPAMVDMRRSEELGGDYPYTSFNQEDLAKLDLPDDVQVGDMLHIHGMLKVTAVSKSDNEITGPCCRVEAALTNVVAVENEDDENEDAEEKPSRRSKLYG